MLMEHKPCTILTVHLCSTTQTALKCSLLLLLFLKVSFLLSKTQHPNLNSNLNINNSHTSSHTSSLTSNHMGRDIKNLLFSRLSILTLTLSCSSNSNKFVFKNRLSPDKTDPHK